MERPVAMEVVMDEMRDNESAEESKAVRRLLILAVVAIVLVWVAPRAWAGESAHGQEAASNEAEVVRAPQASLKLEAGMAQTSAPTMPREADGVFQWPEETFVYSCRINGAEAMRAALRTGDVSYNDGTPYVPVGLNARSQGFFHNLYPVDDRADTFMDPQTFRPHRSEKYFHENGKRRSYVVDFSHSRYRAGVQKRKPKTVHTFTEPIPATTHDMLSWLYELRSQEITQGASFDYYIYDGWKITHLELRVVGAERLYTPAGWFKAWKLAYDRHIVETSFRTQKEAAQDGEEGVKVSRKTTSEHSGHLWLSRDANHLPLRLTIGTSYGLGEVVLLKYDSHNE
jgi:hypothetical protein